MSSFAQQGFNYKAVIKDDQGNVVVNQNVTIQFTILDALSGGGIESQETHYAIMPDANGIVIAIIGEGTQSLSYGLFNDIDWGSHAHYVQVGIDITGGTNFEDMGTSEFMAVPYAKHAEVADNAFSGDYNDLTNQPTTMPTGLERITESIDAETELPIYGWRLTGIEPDNYGNIGYNAVDLSESPFPSTENGATGQNSTAMGEDTVASGRNSTAMGNVNVASGHNSIATGRNTLASGSDSSATGRETVASADSSTSMGHFTKAESFASTVIGRNNIGGFTVTGTGSVNDGDVKWISSDPVFEIGNGWSYVNRSNALTVLKNGTITAPSLSIYLINTAGDKALITKEYADSAYLTESSPLVPVAYGTIESDASVLSGTGNFTASLNAGILRISVNNEEMSAFNSSCLITPYSNAFRTSSIIMTGGDVQVRIFNSSGNLAPVTFQFVIYKL